MPGGGCTPSAGACCAGHGQPATILRCLVTTAIQRCKPVEFTARPTMPMRTCRSPGAATALPGPFALGRCGTCTPAQLPRSTQARKATLKSRPSAHPPSHPPHSDEPRANPANPKRVGAMSTVEAACGQTSADARRTLALLCGTRTKSGTRDDSAARGKRTPIGIRRRSWRRRPGSIPRDGAPSYG
eukprot:877656-Prymnesium_polylepis.2